MLNISIRKLVEAVVDAAAFELPEMDDGTKYLHENVYRKLADGGSVKLSSLDFSAFTLDDISDMQELYNDVLEPNAYKAENMTGTLRGIAPARGFGTFV